MQCRACQAPWCRLTSGAVLCRADAVLKCLQANALVAVRPDAQYPGSFALEIPSCLSAGPYGSAYYLPGNHMSERPPRTLAQSGSAQQPGTATWHSNLAQYPGSSKPVHSSLACSHWACRSLALTSLTAQHWRQSDPVTRMTAMERLTAPLQHC